MANDIGIRIGVDGEKEFKTALSAINAQLKNLSSEMKAAVTSMTGMDSAESRSAKKADILGRSIEVTKQKIDMIRAAGPEKNWIVWAAHWSRLSRILEKTARRH